MDKLLSLNVEVAYPEQEGNFKQFEQNVGEAVQKILNKSNKG